MTERDTDAPASSAATSPDASPDTSPDEATPSYEVAREELVETVRALEAGGTTLEQSLALWEQGERLARICQEHLDGARRRLDAVLETADDD